jgi:hypothetical protein
MVAAFSNASVSGSTSGPRFMSLIDGSSNVDGTSSTARGTLLGRQGGTTPTTTWRTQRASSSLASQTGVYDQLDQLVTIYDGQMPTCTAITARRAPAPRRPRSARPGLRRGTRGAFVSCPNSYWSEALLFKTDLDASDRAEIYDNPKAFFGLP